jgi:exonuclease SbcD
MRIFHTGDVHYCPKHLEEVERCFGYAVSQAILAECRAGIVAGDLFDHRLDAHSPALIAAVRQIQRLANAMPVLLLAGTLSHDPPNVLEIFRSIHSRFPICVADRIQQFALLHDGRWVGSGAHAFDPDDLPPTPILVASCLPAVNKGAVAAAVGPALAAESAGDLVADVLKSWAPSNARARAHGVPTIVVAHGTVNGSLTEHGQPMISLDHEMTSGALWSARADAVMLAHIHRHQSWTAEGQAIAYCSSPGRLHFGEHDPKGFLLWDVEPGKPSFRFVETPAKRLLEIAFTGTPDFAVLRQHAKDAAGAHVRIRYAIDEEHRHSVDRQEIESLFSGAQSVRIEARVLPVQRQRAQGISEARTLQEKLTRWCEFSQVDAEPLLARLQSLQESGPEDVVNAYARE